MKSRNKQISTSSSAKKSTTAVLTCESQSKAYPSISAAYWLPTPNSTPYLLPGKL